MKNYMYREKKPREYMVVQLTKEMIRSKSELPDFLSEFPNEKKIHKEQDCIAYLGVNNTVIRANNGAKIYPKVGDYLGVNSDNDLRYWPKDDFETFYEAVK